MFNKYQTESTGDYIPFVVNEQNIIELHYDQKQLHINTEFDAGISGGIGLKDNFKESQNLGKMIVSRLATVGIGAEMEFQAMHRWEISRTDAVNKVIGLWIGPGAAAHLASEIVFHAATKGKYVSKGVLFSGLGGIADLATTTLAIELLQLDKGLASDWSTYIVGAFVYFNLPSDPFSSIVNYGLSFANKELKSKFNNKLLSMFSKKISKIQTEIDRLNPNIPLLI